MNTRWLILSALVGPLMLGATPARQARRPQGAHSSPHLSFTTSIRTPPIRPRRSPCSRRSTQRS